MRYYLLTMGLIIGLVLSPVSFSNDLVSGFNWHKLPKSLVVVKNKPATNDELKNKQPAAEPENAIKIAKKKAPPPVSS